MEKMDAVHHFYTEHAVKYGVEEAILLYDIIYWIAHNAANGKHFHDGRYWTYNSAAGFGNLHPYWRDDKSGRTDKIQRLLNSLIKQGAIVRGNYNATAYDRTSWYALSDELADSILQFTEIHYAKTRNGICENGEPIPNNKPNNKPNILTSSKEAQDASLFADAPLVADAPQPDKNKRFSYRNALIGAGVTPENTDRLLANRRAKNLKNTEAAFNRLLGSLEQVCNARGVTYNEAIEYAGKHGWGAIEPGWNLEGLTAKTKRSGKLISLDEYIRRESQR